MRRSRRAAIYVINDGQIIAAFWKQGSCQEATNESRDLIWSRKLVRITALWDSKRRQFAVAGRESVRLIWIIDLVAARLFCCAGRIPFTWNHSVNVGRPSRLSYRPLQVKRRRHAHVYPRGRSTDRTPRRERAASPSLYVASTNHCCANASNKVPPYQFQRDCAISKAVA